MNVKKCTVDPKPEPPEPSPCTLQKIKQLQKAGKTICPKEPIPDPEPAPPCLALCIEKIKNFPVPPTPNFPVVCVVEREPTGSARCDAIAEAESEQPDIPWPGCVPPPPLPPPPEPDACEVQKKKERIAQCKERMKRLEFLQAVEEDRSNNRRITIAPVINDSNENCDFDSQIKELETMISNLQNEITDLSKSADIEYVPELSTTESKKSYVIEGNKIDAIHEDPESADIEEDMTGASNKQFNQVFPLLVRDMLFPINPEKPLGTVVSDLLTVEAKSSNNEALINEGKQELFGFVDNSQDYTPKDNLDELIYKLQAEISEQLDTLKDVNIDDACDPAKDAK